MPNIRLKRSSRQRVDVLKNKIKFALASGSEIDENALKARIQTIGFSPAEINAALAELKTEEVIEEV